MPETENCQSDAFQGIRFYDGTSFGYLRVFADKVQLLLDKPFEFALDGTKMHTYRITGKTNDIKLYVDGQLAINAAGNFTQPTSTKLIEFGDISGRNQSIFSTWDSFKYTTVSNYSPNNTEELILERTMTFPESSVGRLKTYKNSLYASVDPIDPDLSSSIYRFEEGKLKDHRSVLAITKASVSAVVIDPNRSSSIFDSYGKFLATDNGLQYILGSKPFPFDFLTSFAQLPSEDGWLLEENCDGSCESLVNEVLTIDTTSEVNAKLHKYTQLLTSDSWVKNANNETGWTVEVKVRIVDDGNEGTIDARSANVAGRSLVEDCSKLSETAVEDDPLFAPGIYINDGTYQEFIQFFQKGIRLKYAGIFGTQKLSDKFYTVRIIGKGTNIAVYAKSDTDPIFKQIIFAPNGLKVKAKTTSPQERPSLFTDEAGIVHAVWQEAGEDEIVIFYSRLNRKEITKGSGLIGSQKFDAETNPINIRLGFGLPPAPDIDYSKIANNVLIAPLGDLLSKNAVAGDTLQIFEQGSNPRAFKIKQVIDDVLVSLETTEDLSNVGPAEWIVVGQSYQWSPSIRVSQNSFDSANPKILYHSNGNIYVAYDNNENGNSEIYVRKGISTATGASWKETLRVTNSAHDARNADLIEISNGKIALVWEDSANDSTGSQIFFALIDNTLLASQVISPVTITPDSLHAKNPKINVLSGDRLVIVYEDDVLAQGVFAIYTIHGTFDGVDFNFTDPLKISSGDGAKNPNITKGFEQIVWDQEINDNRQIVMATLQHFDSQQYTIEQITSSNGNSIHPSIVHPASRLAIVYESDRSRPEFFELYFSQVAAYRFPAGLNFNAATGIIGGIPLETGTFLINISAANISGTEGSTVTITINSSGSTSQGPDLSAADPSLPKIISPLTAVGVIGEAFEYEIRAINNPTSFGISRAAYLTSSGHSTLSSGLDTKLESYLTTNNHPAIAVNPDDSLSIVWQAEREGKRQTIFHANYDGFSSSIDNTILAYFPMNETFGFELKNRILKFDENGFLKETFGRNAISSNNVDAYTTTELAREGVSGFSPDSLSAINFGVNNGAGQFYTFKVPTSEYLRESGAIDIFAKPNWDSSENGSRVFFGNESLNTVTANTMSFGQQGIAGTASLKFRIVDSNGTLHETSVSGTPLNLWDADESLHFRLIWDADNVGTSSIRGIIFSSATIGYACGANGTIFKSTDSGATWTKQQTGLTYDLLSIDFIDDMTGFVCGEFGTVLTTVNGGATWTPLDTGVTVDLTSIYFTTSTNGIVCGSGGTILKTTNGGSTWVTATTSDSTTADLNSISVFSNGSYIVVGEQGKIYTSASGTSFSLVDDLPTTATWNGISRTHQGGSYSTFIVGSGGKVLRTSDDGVTFEDISPLGPDIILPNLLCVAHGANTTTIFIPWGLDKFAYSTDSGDTFTFVDVSLNGFYRAIEGNFDGTSSIKAIVSGAGGRLSKIEISPSVTETLYYASCGNLKIIINGIEPEQTRTGDCSFEWDPTAKQYLFFGDYRENGTDKADAIMSDLIMYNTPNPGHSLFSRRAIQTYQLESTPIITNESGKRIEWGSVSSQIKSESQWKDFKMFYCGAKEPLQHFAWNTTTGLIDDVVLDLALDSRGKIWAATNHGISEIDINLMAGLMSAYLSKTKAPDIDRELFINYSNLANNLITDSVTSIAADKDNNIWAGTDRGLMFLPASALSTPQTEEEQAVLNEEPAKFIPFTGLPSNKILTIEAFDSGVFVGTDSGLAVITQKATAVATLTASSFDVAVFSTGDGLPSNRIQAIAQEKSGRLWIGTDRGLAQVTGKNVAVYNTSNGLISRNVASITINDDDVKYVGTGFGMTRIEGIETKSFPPASGVGPGAINDGAIDPSGVVWLGTSNGLVEMDEACNINSSSPRFTVYDIQDGIIGDNRIRDYERYRILGGPIPVGGCEKALVSVVVNGKQLAKGYSVNPHVPWVTFDKPLTSSDLVDICVLHGWRKVHDFNLDRKNNKTQQAVIETQRSTYNLFRKRYSAGTITLGGNFEIGAANTSTTQYGVFVVPLPGIDGPSISSITRPAEAELLSSVAVGDSFYPDIEEEIVVLPHEVLEAQRIALPSTDAEDISDNYLEFELDVDSIVYVAYDSRSNGLPKWLRTFEVVPVIFNVTDMEIFTDATGQEKLFVATAGTNGCVYDILHDPTICFVSDEIAVDQTPPTGCATIAAVHSKSSMTLALTATDMTTGVTEMQIAPRMDGTIDGEEDSPFIPFQSNYVFELPPEAAATTGDIADIPDDVISGGTTTAPPPDINNNLFYIHLGKLLVGTKDPGRIYEFNQATLGFTLLFDTGEDEVLSMATFGNDLIIGTGNNGKAFRWNGTVLTQLPTSVGEKVLSVWVFNNKVYLGYYPDGEIYTIDEFGIMQLFMDTFETGVTAFATFGNKLYWATKNEEVSVGNQLVTTTKNGHKHFISIPAGTTSLVALNGTTTEADGHTHPVVNGVVQEANGHIHGLNGARAGKIFRHDPATGQSIIVHADVDYAMTALTATSLDSANGILFAGTSPHGKILRFIPEDEIFIKSFQTAKLTVNKLRFYSRMYALVDDDIYSFDGKRWEFVASVTDKVNDIAPETNDNASAGGILVLRNQTIASTSAAPTILNPKLCAYVRFKDAAGNISSIRDEAGALVACYAPCIDLSGDGDTGDGGTGGTGSNVGLTIGKNRLLEVNNDARVLFGLDGTEPFLSGTKIEEEVAIYYSEIFNGTNAFVQWSNLAWDDTTPAGTSITIAIRSSNTNSGITDALWSKEFSNSSTNDITNVTGQFLQFRVTLRAGVKGVASPVLHSVNITLRTSQAVHYFTTNFTLPDELRKGILTYNGCINPPTTDIVFAVSGLDSIDFSDYFIITPDKVFELPSEHQTKNLRVGIKLISSPTEISLVDEFAMLVSLANDAKIKFNLAGQPASTTGQIGIDTATRTVITERVQNHTHSVTFDSSILDKSAINGRTSINAGHSHLVLNGITQQSAGHGHNFSI